MLLSVVLFCTFVYSTDCCTAVIVIDVPQLLVGLCGLLYIGRCFLFSHPRDNKSWVAVLCEGAGAGCWCRCIYIEICNRLVADRCHVCGVIVINRVTT